MKARIAYPLLFLLPSAMAAFLSAFIAGAAGAGLLWIFVYGDNPWPPVADTLVMGFACAVALGTLVLLLLACHAFGKAREARGGLARAHIAVALGLSVLLPVLALLHQWQVGNLG